MQRAGGTGRLSTWRFRYLVVCSADVVVVTIKSGETEARWGAWDAQAQARLAIEDASGNRVAIWGHETTTVQLFTTILIAEGRLFDCLIEYV